MPQDLCGVEAIESEALPCGDYADADFQEFITELGRSVHSSEIDMY